MDRNKIPLRFTILWAVNLAIMMVLERTLKLSEMLPLSYKDTEVVYCTAAGVLAALELTIWNRFDKKNQE